VRQSMVSSRRRFETLPAGSVTIEPCPGGAATFTDATCHGVRGLSSGPALVWLDRRQQLTAAVLQTPWGALVVTSPERTGARAAVLEQFDVYSRTRD
jgi:hypothetical protein